VSGKVKKKSMGNNESGGKAILAKKKGVEGGEEGAGILGGDSQKFEEKRKTPGSGGRGKEGKKRGGRRKGN